MFSASSISARKQKHVIVGAGQTTVENDVDPTLPSQTPFPEHEAHIILVDSPGCDLKRHPSVRRADTKPAQFKDRGFYFETVRVAIRAGGTEIPKR